MGTPRVPESKLVYALPWLELHEKDGYVFSHSPKWKGVAVAILPYRTIPAAHGFRYEFLAVKESRPCHGGETFIASITGAYDKPHLSLAECALEEVAEEGGYVCGIHQVTELGWVNGSKSGDGIDHLFAVEIDDLTHTCEVTGDGSAMEEGVEPVWITTEELINSKDMILITMYTRWLHRSLLK